MEYSRVVNTGASPAPNPGKPGMGRGNVPFAPGIMSGNLGTNQPSPLARQTAPPRVLNQSQGPPPPAPQGPQQPPGGMGMGMAPGMINPQVYFQFLESWMKALVQATEQPGGSSFGVY